MVVKPTRIRIGQARYILEIVFANYVRLISYIEHLMNHRQPAESMRCAVQVEEPVGCDARVYSDHSPTPSHSRREMDDL